MALDHANARSSAMNVGSPWRCRLPIPDGAISAQDRAHAAYMYILASGSSAAPSAGADDYIITFRRRRR